MVIYIQLHKLEKIEMKNRLRRLRYLSLLLFTTFCCQSKEEKEANITFSSEAATNKSYFGKWFLVNKYSDSYYYCTDSDRLFELGKNKIFDHTPVEDSHFNIDHVKTRDERTYFYIDQQETSYYILKWIDKSKGIISYQFNNYDPILFVSEKDRKRIDSKTCNTKIKSCQFNDLSNNYKFSVEESEYQDEKAQKYPTAAWIIITNKKKSKIAQEIRFEPNSWAIYSELPCDGFIVKDFNFDGLEDFAIVWDDGGNAGRLYEYYFQDKEGNFSTSTSFPLQHGVLADDVDNVKKTITTASPVGCCSINVNTYILRSNGTWEGSTRQEKLKNN